MALGQWLENSDGKKYFKPSVRVKYRLSCWKFSLPCILSQEGTQGVPALQH